MAEDPSDGHSDVVIAGSTAESVVTMLMGSGSWSFEEQTPLMLVYPLTPVSLRRNQRRSIRGECHLRIRWHCAPPLTE